MNMNWLKDGVMGREVNKKMYRVGDVRKDVEKLQNLFDLDNKRILPLFQCCAHLLLLQMNV